MHRNQLRRVVGGAAGREQHRVARGDIERAVQRATQRRSSVRDPAADREVERWHWRLEARYR